MVSHISEMERKAVISVMSFYSGTPTGTTKKNYFRNLKKRKKIGDREKAYKRRPLSDLQMYVKVFSERRIWQWFGRQQDALDFCLEMKEAPVRLFAYEKADSKRKFLVTTLKQFWKRYSSMPEGERHFYEVICVDDLCRLYFDIEYQKDLNPDLDGLVILNNFIGFVCHCLYKEFGLACSRANIVDLESSTESKFSRHLIFHLEEKTMFINNVVCGLFVKDICYCLKSYLETGKSNKFLPIIPESKIDEDRLCVDNRSPDLDLNSLMVKSNDATCHLCDLGVYSRNRNFRLYKSSKVSKNTPLVIAKENEFTFTSKLTRKEEKMYRNRGEIFDPDFQQFCETLICNHSNNNKTLSYGDHITLPVTKKCVIKPYKDGAQSSPFPKLDEFVLNYVHQNCKRGVINKWLSFDSNVIIYDIRDNRWCGNIRREHKSNHPYYVADLKLKYLYQKCHDPDCANFRASGIWIPDCVNPIIKTAEIEDLDLSRDVELNKLFSTEFDFDGIYDNNFQSMNFKTAEDGKQVKDRVISCNETNTILGTPCLTSPVLNDIKPAEWENVDDKELVGLFDEDFMTTELTGCDHDDYVIKCKSLGECNINEISEILFDSTNDNSLNLDCEKVGPASCTNTKDSSELENVINKDEIDDNHSHNNDDSRDATHSTNNYEEDITVPASDTLQYTFPNDLDFSELMDKTPLRYLNKDFSCNLSGVSHFSPPLSPSLVSTHKKYAIHKPKCANQSDVVSNAFSCNSEFDSKILNELFSVENSDNEFSAML